MRYTLLTAYLLIQLLGIIPGCKGPEPKLKPLALTLEASYDLPVAETSGLSLTSDNQGLFTVSDQDGRIYRLSLSGGVIATLNYEGDDPEGIAIDPADGSLWIVEEKNSYLAHTDMLGNILDTFSIELNLTDVNSGMEGIAVDESSQKIYVLTEKDPALLLELDKAGNILNQVELDFAEDYSALSYDAIENELWIYSDKSASIYRCDTKGSVLQRASLPIAEGEGLAINTVTSKVYIVSDTPAKLFVYQIE